MVKCLQDKLIIIKKLCIFVGLTLVTTTWASNPLRCFSVDQLQVLASNGGIKDFRIAAFLYETLHKYPKINVWYRV